MDYSKLLPRKRANMTTIKGRGGKGKSLAQLEALQSMIRMGKAADLKKKLGTKDCLAVDSSEQTLLHVACLEYEPNQEIIQLLLNKKSDLGAVDQSGWTPMHCICSVSCDVQIIRLLVEQGADLKAENNDGNQPLHYFVRKGLNAAELKPFEETLDFMIEHGAFINARNKHGETPLHQSILRGSMTTFVMLLKRDANIFLANKYGETSLHYAVRALKKKIVEMLLDLGMEAEGGSGAVGGSELEMAKQIGQPAKEIYDLLVSYAAEAQTNSLTTVGTRRGDLSGAEDLTTQELKLKMLKKNHSWQIDYNELVLMDCIGKGAFGAVYKAKWRGTTVAMKKIHAQGMSKKEIDTFFREIHTISKLRHPNIVLFLGACLTEPNICFISEFVSKGDLHQVLKREPNIPWQTKLKLAIEGARGMLYLHMCSPPVVHRDLKSLNLLVDESYRVKVTDFGISKSLSSTLETGNSKLGTLNWLAPEILENKPYSPAADVYSYGIILWEILTQKTPFEGMANFKILKRVTEGEGPDIPADCPNDYKSLMKDCWLKDAKMRPGMSEVLEALEEIYDRALKAQEDEEGEDEVLVAEESQEEGGPEDTPTEQVEETEPKQEVKVEDNDSEEDTELYTAAATADIKSMSAVSLGDSDETLSSSKKKKKHKHKHKRKHKQKEAD